MICNRQITTALQFKYGMIYRDVINVKKTDWCKGSKTGTTSDKGLQQMMTILKAGDPSTIHECPYKVPTASKFCLLTQCFYFLQEFVMKNFTFKANLMENVFPTGDYKMKLSFWNIKDVLIFNFTSIASFKSSNRDTFG